MQLLCDFCDHSNPTCDHCKLPDLFWDFLKILKGGGFLGWLMEDNQSNERSNRASRE